VTRRCSICKQDFEEGQEQEKICNHSKCQGIRNELSAMLDIVFKEDGEVLSADAMQERAGLKPKAEKGSYFERAKVRQRGRMDFRRKFLYPWIDAGMVVRVYGVQRGQYRCTVTREGGLGALFG
jgi:hypothetical protein